MAAVATEARSVERALPPFRLSPGRIFQYAVLIVVALAILGPILTAVFGGFKTTGELFVEPFGIPRVFRWENYTDVLSSPLFWRGLGNSGIIVFGTVSLTVICSSLLAFVFSRLQFRGRELLFNFFTLGLLFPITIAFLPVFIQVKQLSLIDSYFGVILPLVAFGIPSSTLILRGFFRGIPSELEDAAYIDGCGTMGFFWYVLLPLARPALGAIVVLQTIVAWNDYFLSLIVLTDDSKWPLTLGIMQFQGQYGTDWARVMAYISILIVPAVLFYIFTQRYIVTGLTGGELKG
ncbi:MAG: carbohydrate ABC transporter permease [Anaerolinea sp.]|nr:carbohydrate ABC transporter permease [Anaerolinea sp.]